MSWFEPPDGDIAHLIQLAVAPVFLLSGVGLTLNMFTTRLARIVDRARALEKQHIADEQQSTEMHQALEALARRATYINVAITLGTVSALLVTLTVMLLFANAWTGNLVMPIVIVFVAAMLALTAALLVFLIEVRIATATVRFGHRVPRPGKAPARS
jgi:CBS domain containing-hemolysin-like protein